MGGGLEKWRDGAAIDEWEANAKWKQNNDIKQRVQLIGEITLNNRIGSLDIKTMSIETGFSKLTTKQHRIVTL